MPTKKPEAQTGKLEREYTIPLRKKTRVVPRYKKTNKAVKTVKEFLARHMKIRDGDLRKVKIDKYLNEALWSRGIRKPPHKIKVKAIKESSGEVRAELLEIPEKIKYKKAREEKQVQKAKAILESKKTMMEKAKEVIKPTTTIEKQTEEEKQEEKEKKSAVVEAGKELEKAQAKKAKHEAKIKAKEPKHQFRQALAK